MQYERTPEAIECLIEQLLSQMTIEEKVAMCHANSTFCSAGCERLGISEVVMSDGPHGVRAEVSRESWENIADADDAITYLPVGIALGATWNRERAYEFGQVLGAEARSRGKDVILGPGVNIIRTPLCGRNFEYIGEDPCHVGTSAAAIIKGIQENDVAACVKHYALNNQELNRMGVDVICDERTLREIYLPAFETTVKEGGVFTFMGAYNKFRGQHCCHNDYLINKILKQEWGFQGLVVSDWGGVHDTDEAARNGLDIEMGGNMQNLYLAAPFLEGLKNGRYSEALVNDKVRRILRVLFAIGHDHPQRAAGARNTRRHQQIAKQIADEALVLLKNANRFLPLNTPQIKTLAVIGENAEAQHAGGGGSSGIKALYESTPLEALKKLLGDEVRIIHEKGYPCLPSNMEPVPANMLSAPDVSGIGGWWMETYDNRRHEGEPVKSETVPEINVACEKVPLPGLVPGNWSIVWRGRLNAPADETVQWVIHGGDNWLMRINGKMVACAWDLTTPALFFEKYRLEAGKTYEIEVELHPKCPGGSLQVGWLRETAQDSPAAADDNDMQSAALAAAREADAVLFFGGSSHMLDVEGQDRKSYDLPGGQDELIEALAEANPNMAVILFGGSAVRLPWIDKVPALLQVWYPGSEGGNAIADALFGNVCPSGKLPFSWPTELDDYAAHARSAYAADCVEYTEGLFSGYRWHDLENSPAPLFPFGFGLSYTGFELEDAALEQSREDGIVAEIAVTVRNTGKVAGAEVIQLYVSSMNASVPRPVKELKAFEKVFLQPGESRRITLPLTVRDLSYYDGKRACWNAEPGEYKLLLGTSAADIRNRLTLDYRIERDAAV